MPKIECQRGDLAGIALEGVLVRNKQEAEAVKRLEAEADRLEAQVCEIATNAERLRSASDARLAGVLLQIGVPEGDGVRASVKDGPGGSFVIDWEEAPGPDPEPKDANEGNQDEQDEALSKE